MPSDFKLGDLVKHKTGGPVWVVEQLNGAAILGEGSYLGCRFVSADGKWHRKFFKPEELEHAK